MPDELEWLFIALKGSHFQRRRCARILVLNIGRTFDLGSGEMSHRVHVPAGVYAVHVFPRVALQRGIGRTAERISKVPRVDSGPNSIRIHRRSAKALDHRDRRIEVVKLRQS